MLRLVMSLFSWFVLRSWSFFKDYIVYLLSSNSIYHRSFYDFSRVRDS